MILWMGLGETSDQVAFLKTGFCDRCKDCFNRSSGGQAETWKVFKAQWKDSTNVMGIQGYPLPKATPQEIRPY